MRGVLPSRSLALTPSPQGIRGFDDPKIRNPQSLNSNTKIPRLLKRSNDYTVKPPYCRTAIPPYRQTAVPPYHHTAKPPYRHTAIPSYRHTAIPSNRRTAIPPYRQTAKPSNRHTAKPKENPSLNGPSLQHCNFLIITELTPL